LVRKSASITEIQLQLTVARPRETSLRCTSSTTIGITTGYGDLDAGNIVTLTVNFSAAVTVDTTNGTPTLALNDGGTATYASGSGSSALTFTCIVAAGQNTADLTVTALHLNGGTIQTSGIDADVSGAATNPAGILQIDTTPPTIVSVAISPTALAFTGLDV